jgi:uncharacterized protein DUF2442
MHPQIVKVEALQGLRLWLQFSDGLSGEADLSHLADKGVFRRWNVPGEFEKVQLDADAGTVVWPGGLDVAPDALYARIRGDVQSAANA